MESILAMYVVLLLISAIGIVSYREVPKILKQRKELQTETIYNFSELDQEIAEKEKELRALKEVKEKEKRLKELDKQINAVNMPSQELSIALREVINSKANNSLMSAEEVRKLQKTTHWSDDKELLKTYNKSFEKVLKDIEKKISEQLPSERKRVRFTVVNNPIKLISQNYSILDQHSTPSGEIAISDFLDNIVEELTRLGYTVKLEKLHFSTDIVIEW